MLAVAGALIVVGGGIAAWFGTRPASSAATTTRVVTVAPATLDQSVASTGTVEPAQQADLSFVVSGVVAAVDVSVGQKVTAGETLATLDPTQLDATLAQAQATLALDQAKLSSDQAADASAAQLDADEAAVVSAQAQVSSAQADVSDAALTSTITGTVASVGVSVGESVGAGGSTAGGSTAGGSTAGGSAGTSAAASSTAQFVVVSTGSFVVDTSVDDSQVGRVAAGDQAVVTVAGSTTAVYGTVGSVGLEATASSGVASFPVVVDVTGSPAGLYGGTSANVTIITKVLQDVLEVPTLALRSSTAGGVTVDVLEQGHQVARAVTVGIAAGGETQVVHGLTVGEQVVVPLLRATRPGAAGSGRGGLLAGGGGFGGGGGRLGGGGRFVGAGGFGGGGGGG